MIHSETSHCHPALGRHHRAVNTKGCILVDLMTRADQRREDCGIGGLEGVGDGGMVDQGRESQAIGTHGLLACLHVILMR